MQLKSGIFSFSFVVVSILFTCFPCEVEAVNYDESKIPNYTLPDPLTCLDGTKVTDAKMWREKRRPEIIGLFEEHVYGRAPGKPSSRSYEMDQVTALDGKAIRKQVKVRLLN